MSSLAAIYAKNPKANLRPLPSQPRLRELLDYDPETGVLRWRLRAGTDRFTKTWNARYAGTVAGYIANHGYITITIDGVDYYAHRVIWKLVTGDEPPEIDHENGIRSDNRAENLLASTNAENMKNTKMHRNNTSGVCGVHWSNFAGKWVANIGVNGGSRHLGYFTDIEEAARARRAAEQEHNYGARHGRKS